MGKTSQAKKINKRSTRFDRNKGPFCEATARHKVRNGDPNGKCKLPAGFGTDHVGEGRCKFHGGAVPIKHGRYTHVKTNSIKDLFDKLEASQEKDPLDLIPDLQLARAVLIDFINRYQEYSEALIAWHRSYSARKYKAAQSKPQQILDIADASRMIERVARIVSTIHKIQEAGSISLKTFKQLQEAMAISVAKNVKDSDILAAIEKDWSEIRVHATTDNT